MSKKIVLIGDFAIDLTIYVKATRLCPEAPVPVVVPLRETITDGMAGNVLNNMKSISEFPDDAFIVYQPKFTSHKTRFVDEATGYMVLRVDRDVNGVTEPFNPRVLKKLKPRNIAAIVLSDYAKGFLNEKNIEEIAEYAKTHKIPSFLDTKLILGPWSQDIFCVKINEKEYGQNLALNAQKIQMSTALSPRFYCKHLVVTYASKGSCLMTRTDDIVVPTNKVQVADVCGAGDTMLAGLVLRYLSRPDLVEAIRFANAVASFAVTKHGVYCVTAKDVENMRLSL